MKRNLNTKIKGYLKESKFPSQLNRFGSRNDSQELDVVSTDSELGNVDQSIYENKFAFPNQLNRFGSRNDSEELQTSASNSGFGNVDQSIYGDRQSIDSTKISGDKLQESGVVSGESRPDNIPIKERDSSYDKPTPVELIKDDSELGFASSAGVSDNGGSDMPIASSTTSDITSVSASNIESGELLQNLVLNAGYIRSGNYSAGVSGWDIEYDGTAQFNDITLIGGSFSYGKTSFTDSTHAGYYFGSEGSYIGAALDATYLKYTIADGSYDYVGTISSRSTAILAAAIDSAGHFIDNALDTSAKNILGEFTFGVSGALQIGEYEAGVSGDIKISPSGILGRNSSNETTFSIDGTTGNATFGGTLVAASGTFGTITSGSLEGLTVTGGTIQTATTGQRVKIDSTGLMGYASNGSANLYLNNSGVTEVIGIYNQGVANDITGTHSSWYVTYDGQGRFERIVLNTPLEIAYGGTGKTTGGGVDYVVDSGSTDDYAVTLSPAPESYADGLTLLFKANTANTGAATLNCNSLGPAEIRKKHDQALDTNDIEAGQLVLVAFNYSNPEVVDSYTESGTVDEYYSLPSVDDNDKAVGQSFTNDTKAILTSCKFYILKSGSPTGNCYAKLYAHSGAYGTESIPTGSALATSDAVAVSSIGGSGSLITFTFSGANQYVMQAGTYYVIVVEYTGGTPGTNIIQVGGDVTSSSHDGNWCLYKVSTNWNYAASRDLAFYVYGKHCVFEMLSQISN